MVGQTGSLPDQNFTLTQVPSKVRLNPRCSLDAVLAVLSILDLATSEASLRGQAIMSIFHCTIKLLGRRQCLSPVNIVSKPMHAVLIQGPYLELSPGCFWPMTTVRVDCIVLKVLKHITQFLEPGQTFVKGLDCSKDGIPYLRNMFKDCGDSPESIQCNHEEVDVRLIEADGANWVKGLILRAWPGDAIML